MGATLGQLRAEEQRLATDEAYYEEWAGDSLDDWFPGWADDVVADRYERLTFELE